jgi:autotransporter translocation and assembly factor TamB
MLKLALALVLLAGCDLFKPATIRCESVPSAVTAPEVPKERQEKLAELADLQLDIDLEIARADKHEIEIDQQMDQAAHEVSQKALREHAKNVGQLFHQALEASEETGKTLERIARHRCH